MHTKKYHWLLYLIAATISITVAVQVYWNQKNYAQNKQRILNEIQISLDNAVETYYTQIVKTADMSYFNHFSDSIHMPKDIDTLIVLVDSIQMKSKAPQKEQQMKFKMQHFIIDADRITDESANIEIEVNDKMKGFVNSVLLSMRKHPLNLEDIKKELDKELQRKNIRAPFGFIHFENDRIKNSFHTTITAKEGSISMLSKSTFLKSNEKLQLFIENPIKEVFKRSLTGILLSFALTLLVISLLFYLLKIIHNQKALAIIKNDLISNITHEFKTPITTVTAALEAINTFNAIDDKEKTKKYISISNFQLGKLNGMVEKLLETATLDSEQLLLKKETVDVIPLIKNIFSNDSAIPSQKQLKFHSSKDGISMDIDPFHFENAIRNLIDNAIKYGGNEIEIQVAQIPKKLEIIISDSGNGIDKTQRDKIFDKFYRIPEGNTHTVKGFGIGLYYTKTIIEKHGGTILLVPNNEQTTFKITLPL